MDRRATDLGLAEDSLAARVVIGVNEQHGRALYGFARRLGLPEEIAEDAVQEALLRLFRALWRGSAIDDPRAWTFHALYRIVIDEHRLRVRVTALRERLLRRPNEVVVEPDVAGSISIWASVDRLPARQRHVLYLRYRADLPYEDIARILGITAGGARRTAAKGLDRLRHLPEFTGEA